MHCPLQAFDLLAPETSTGQAQGCRPATNKRKCRGVRAGNVRGTPQEALIKRAVHPQTLNPKPRSRGRFSGLA